MAPKRCESVRKMESSPKTMPTHMFPEISHHTAVVCHRSVYMSSVRLVPPPAPPFKPTVS